MTANHALAVPRADALDLLATPVAWTDAEGRVVGANVAFGHWLEVSLRRLPGMPLAALEGEVQRLAQWFAEPPEGDPLRLRRLRLAFPGTGALRYADLHSTRKVAYRAGRCIPRGYKGMDATSDISHRGDARPAMRRATVVRTA